MGMDGAARALDAVDRTIVLDWRDRIIRSGRILTLYRWLRVHTLQDEQSEDQQRERVSRAEQWARHASTRRPSGGARLNRIYRATY